jgi:hypothetical protein
MCSARKPDAPNKVAGESQRQRRKLTGPAPPLAHGLRAWWIADAIIEQTTFAREISHVVSLGHGSPTTSFFMPAPAADGALAVRDPTHRS